MELLNLPHANMRDENGKPVNITLVKMLISGWYYSTASKCTHVVSNGGAIVPVLSSPEEVHKIYISEAEQVSNPKQSKKKTKETANVVQ